MILEPGQMVEGSPAYTCLSKCMGVHVFCGGLDDPKSIILDIIRSIEHYDRGTAYFAEKLDGIPGVIDGREPRRE